MLMLEIIKTLINEYIYNNIIKKKIYKLKIN